MARKELVPIRVRIKRGVVDGQKQAIYPNFNLIDHAIRKGLPWSVYIDVEGIGWEYDKVNNIGKGDEFGTCVTCVPEDFAVASASLFPDDVTIMTELEYKEFYEGRVTMDEPDEVIDNQVVDGIIKRLQLNSLLSQQEKTEIKYKPGLTEREKIALDPSNDVLGIRKNKRKRWLDRKASLGLKIKQNLSDGVTPNE